MDDAASTATELVFQFDIAAVAGLIAVLAVLLPVMLMLAFLPLRFPMNPLYLLGSAVTIETTYAYLSGLLMFLVGGVLYGSVVAAVQVGFEVASLAFLFGAATGGALFIVSGTTFAYSRALHRGVRIGLIGDPGPFLLRYGKATLAQLAVAHILFGAVAGQLYQAFI